MLPISGEARFAFRDEFADPHGLRVAPGGTPYPFAGNRTARFGAEIVKDGPRSTFDVEGRR